MTSGAGKLGRGRLVAGTARANALRNARSQSGRHTRWAPARAAAAAFLFPALPDDARVAVVGAGNGDTLPLRELARRSRHLTLVDIDGLAIASARRRLPRELRARVNLLEHDVTGGQADRILAATVFGGPGRRTGGAAREGDSEAGGAAHTSLADGRCDPIPGAPYDLVVADLFYSQMLYPALCDLRVPEPELSATLTDHGPGLTRLVVRRLHAAAPTGQVIHLHDPVAWWPGHRQAVRLEEILAVATTDPLRALELAGRGTGPSDSDPRRALAELDIPILATRLWPWPFTVGVDYLVAATLAGQAGPEPVRALTPEAPGPEADFT